MYAIVRCGGRQQKVSVGDVLEVDKVAGEVGSRISLPTVLVVNDGDVRFLQRFNPSEEAR